MAYNYEVKHIRGKNNAIADYLSCLLTLPGAPACPQNAPNYPRQIRTFKSPIQVIRVVSEDHIQNYHDLFKMAQNAKEDPDYQSLIKCIVEKKHPSPPNDTRFNLLQINF